MSEKKPATGNCGKAILTPPCQLTFNGLTHAKGHGMKPYPKHSTKFGQEYFEASFTVRFDKKNLRWAKFINTMKKRNGVVEFMKAYPASGFFVSDGDKKLASKSLEEIKPYDEVMENSYYINFKILSDSKETVKVVEPLEPLDPDVDPEGDSAGVTWVKTEDLSPGHMVRIAGTPASWKYMGKTGIRLGGKSIKIIDKSTDFGWTFGDGDEDVEVF